MGFDQEAHPQTCAPDTRRLAASRARGTPRRPSSSLSAMVSSRWVRQFKCLPGLGRLMPLIKWVTALVLTFLWAQSAALTPNNQPVDPYRIADGLYFVGASDISSYLITTADGHILIDAGYETTAPQIEANLARL